MHVARFAIYFLLSEIPVALFEYLWVTGGGIDDIFRDSPGLRFEPLTLDCPRQVQRSIDTSIMDNGGAHLSPHAAAMRDSACVQCVPFWQSDDRGRVYEACWSPHLSASYSSRQTKNSIDDKYDG